MDGVFAFSYLYTRGFCFRAHRDFRIYRVLSILVAMHGRSSTRTDTVRVFRYGEGKYRQKKCYVLAMSMPIIMFLYLYYGVLSSKYGVTLDYEAIVWWILRRLPRFVTGVALTNVKNLCKAVADPRGSGSICDRTNRENMRLSLSALDFSSVVN